MNPANLEKASLYYVGGYHETKELINSAGEPWRPLSKFITSENPHFKPRTFDEIVELKAKRDQYRQEYAQCKLFRLLTSSLGLLILDSMELYRYQQGREWRS